MRSLRLRFFVVLAVLAACKQSGTLVTPPSFERPEDIAFVCLTPDTMGALRIEPLDACNGIDEENDAETRKLVALVTQTATGEIGAVDLAEADVLDSDPAVPGYTFLGIGEAPSGLAVSQSGRLTYVATFGSRAITPIYTEDLLGSLVAPATGTELVDHLLAEGPSDLVIFETAGVGFLYVPLPAAGTVVEIPIDGMGGFGTERVLTFGAPGASVLPADEVVDYDHQCPSQGEPVHLAARAHVRPMPTAGAARPVRLRVDTQSSPPVLLVADQGQAVIHRFELTAAGAMEIGGIATDTPVIDVAVTPAVPRDDGMPATERYLYAIDAIGGGVFVLDYTPASATFGRTLAVNAAGGFPSPDVRDDSDRIPLSARARTLEVVATNGVVDCAARGDDVGPTSLNGVFVVAGLDDGTIAFIDVYDRDATCRATSMCDVHPVSEDLAVSIRRHRPRLGALRDDPGIEIVGAPRVLVGTTVRNVEDSGATTDGPVLAAVTCGPGYGVLFPEGGVGGNRICALADPWSNINQSWRAVWEGALPNTNTLVGALSLATSVVTVDGRDLCALGILGTNDGPPGTEPELGYAGDQLEVLAELPPSTQDDPGCARFVIPDMGTRDPITFAILDARSDSLTLGGALESGYTLADVDRCFLSAFRFQVRTRSSFVVTGTRSGFTHRVAADVGTGDCAVDVVNHPYDPSDPRTARFGRAIPGTAGIPFVHPLVTFRFDPALMLDEGDTAELAFDVGDVPARLQYDIGLSTSSSAVPESIVFNAQESRLYVVDIADSTVVRYDLDPITVKNGFQ